MCVNIIQNMEWECGKSFLSIAANVAAVCTVQQGL